MTDRPTPETDAEVTSYFEKKHPPIVCYHELAKFARRLERERDDLLDRLTSLEQSMPIELAKFEREREEAREEIATERALADRLANALMACERWVNQPCDVKTEADKALIEWKEARK